ncbi:hypothetical protein WN51_05524 [Melipona quadrifasciata]|uniref:Uncharacterized protein n=1 Tax=Melipona quadrifasciata TaxID=166423 RepID=A0A0M8ZUH1_9HYME|nr:hypothetical protein WN51_05524 [Melipona quadrifasciata]
MDKSQFGKHRVYEYEKFLKISRLRIMDHVLELVDMAPSSNYGPTIDAMQNKLRIMQTEEDNPQPIYRSTGHGHYKIYDVYLMIDALGIGTVDGRLKTHHLSNKLFVTNKIVILEHRNLGRPLQSDFLAGRSIRGPILQLFCRYWSTPRYWVDNHQKETKGMKGVDEGTYKYSIESPCAKDISTTRLSELTQLQRDINIRQYATEWRTIVGIRETTTETKRNISLKRAMCCLQAIGKLTELRYVYGDDICDKETYRALELGVRYNYIINKSTVKGNPCRGENNKFEKERDGDWGTYFHDPQLCDTSVCNPDVTGTKHRTWFWIMFAQTTASYQLILPVKKDCVAFFDLYDTVLHFTNISYYEFCPDNHFEQIRYETYYFENHQHCMKVIALDITIAAQRKCVVLTVETRYDVTKKFQNNVSATKLVGKFAIDIKKQKYDIENYLLPQDDTINADKYCNQLDQLKNSLRGKPFKSISEIKTHLDEYFTSKLKQFWKEGIMRLPERWKKIAGILE